MRLARSLFLVLLVLTILPWGAYAAAFSASGSSKAFGVYTFARPHAASDDQAVLPSLDTVKVFVKKKCRTANLPGSACGLDIALNASAQPPAYSASTPVQRAADGWGATGLSQAPPGDPPRSF